MTINIERVLSIALLTPMDDPSLSTCRWGAPVLFWGGPGIGKSERIARVGHLCGLSTEELYLATHLPEDLSGVPMPDGKGGATRLNTLPQVHRLTTLGRGLLFLDELSCARPAVQGAALGVIQARAFAGTRMPGGIRLVAAANPPEEAAGGWSLAPPMANRFLHFDYPVPSTTEWSEWLLENERTSVISMEHGEDTVKTHWGTAWSKIKGQAAGFMHAHRDNSKLYSLPPDGHPSRGRAWVSPRSLNMGLRCLAAASALDLGNPALQKKEPDQIRMADHHAELLTAAVGIGLTAEWVKWVADADLPDPADVLANGWTPNHKRLDIAMAVYSSIAAYALNRPNKTEERKAVLRCFEVLSGSMQHDVLDMAFSPCRALLKAGYIPSKDAEVLAVAKDLVARFGHAKMSKLW